ncbi:MAG: hypothetical protein QOG10_6121 [Kribbellaceae bacterium]|jgi:hypothetical protein|nr:hypothetical protein [Kribbellaceae bacterium]
MTAGYEAYSHLDQPPWPVLTRATNARLAIYQTFD